MGNGKCRIYCKGVGLHLHLHLHLTSGSGFGVQSCESGWRPTSQRAIAGACGDSALRGAGWHLSISPRMCLIPVRAWLRA